MVICITNYNLAIKYCRSYVSNIVWEVEEAYDIKFFLMLYDVLDGPLLLSKVIFVPKDVSKVVFISSNFGRSSYLR